MRVTHWTKNILVFFPLLFSRRLFDADSLLLTCAGFAAFSLASSAVYAMNDLVDLEVDRLHPSKSQRPLAAGELTEPSVLRAAVILALTSLAISAELSLAVGSALPIAINVLYLVANMLYSNVIKHVPVADVALLSSFYVMRIYYGSALCSAPVSSWLFLTVFTLSLAISLGKRKVEIKEVGENLRGSLRGYDPRSLTIFTFAFMVAGIVFYALWAVKTDSPLLVGTVPIAVFSLMRYCQRMERDGIGDPVELVVGDPWMVALIALWGILVFVSLYVR